MFMATQLLFFDKTYIPATGITFLHLNYVQLAY